MRQRQIGPALVVLCALATGCSGALKPTPAMPTDGLAPTRAAVAAVECLAGVLRPVVPDTDEARTAWAGLGAAVAAGYAICDAWEDAGEAPSTWADWVVRVLSLVEDLTVVLMDAGVDVPSYVGIAVGAIKLLLPIIAGAMGAI